MDAIRRKQYLDALGITVWQRRVAGSAIEPAVAEAMPMTASLERSPPVTSTPQPATATPRALPAADAGNETVASMDWDTLAATVRDCQKCRLRSGCTQTVFGVGHRGARLLVVGEGPGADEDRIGEPFVGRAGKLLDAMLAAIGRMRTDHSPAHGVYIANIVKCRPPNNRDPAPDEAAACRPYLERQIELIQPRLILAVGRIAAQNLLMTDVPIGKLRGPVHHYGPRGTPVIVTYHPAYLLRSPREKARAWEDLKKARALLGAA